MVVRDGASLLNQRRVHRLFINSVILPDPCVQQVRVNHRLKSEEELDCRDRGGE